MDIQSPPSGVAPAGRRLKFTLASARWRQALPAPLRRWRRVWRLIANYRYDFQRYVRASSVLQEDADQGRLEARILKTYHSLEKGLALPAPRAGFGARPVATLIGQLQVYLPRYGQTAVAQQAINVLAAHRAFNTGHGRADPAVDAFLATYETAIGAAEGGTFALTRAEVETATRAVEPAFFKTRHSVRQFAAADVPPDVLETAVDCARFAPSVCNRQSARIYLVQGDEVSTVLGFQNGNRGFETTIRCLAIVTADMRSFTSIGERNQCWIDGGLFAMAFCYALHAQAVGTCMLNWSAEKEQDLAMRRHVGIPDHEAVITFMAIGCLRDAFVVARSPRRELNEIGTYIGSPSAPAAPEAPRA